MKRVLLLSLFILLLIPLAGCVSKEEKRNALMDNAKILEEKQDYAAARKEARNALEIDPAYAGAYLLLGRCDMKEEKWQDALNHFTKAHALAPDDVEILLHLSRVALLAAEVEQAEDYTKKALALQPDSIELNVRQASILMRKNDFAGAKPLLEEAVKAEPGNEEAVVALASLYLKAGEQAPLKALLGAAIAKKPDSSAVLSLLLSLAFREDDIAATERYIDRLLALKPGDEQLLIQKADLLILQKKDKAEVMRYLAQSLEKNPAADAVRVRLAELFLTDGNLAGCLEQLDKAPAATPRIRLAKATILLRSGRADEGRGMLRALSDDKSAGEFANAALFALAEVRLQHGELDAAIQTLTSFIGRSQENPRAYSLRGQVFFSLKRFPEAAKDFETVVKLAPDDPAAAIALADAQNSNGDHALAESTIRGVIRNKPDFAPAYIALANYFMVNTNPYEALEAVRAGKKALPDNIELLIAEPDILIQEKRYTEAVDLLNVLLKKDAAKPSALARLAAVHIAEKQYDKAVSAYDDLLKLDPNSMQAVDGRIRTHLAAGQPDKALAFAEKRQKERPEDPMAALLVGETALVNKDPKKAENAFFKALELSPQWDQPATRLAQIYTATRRIDPGITAIQKLVDKHPDAVGPVALLANLQEQKADWQGAEASYRTMLERFPQNILAANNLAYLLSTRTPTAPRLEEAERIALIAAASNNATTLDTLGWVQHLRGKHAEAESTLRKAHEGARQNPAVAYHLAAALAAQKLPPKNDEARKLLQEALAAKTPFSQRKDAEELLKKI